MLYYCFMSSLQFTASESDRLRSRYWHWKAEMRLYYFSILVFTWMVLRSSEIESCGLGHLLNYDGAFHWHGSASNVSGLAVRAVNNLVSLSVSLSAHMRLLCANERRLPTIATAYAPAYGPTAEQASESRLISRFHERNRDLWTRKARAPPLVQQTGSLADIGVSTEPFLGW